VNSSTCSLYGLSTAPQLQDPFDRFTKFRLLPCCLVVSALQFAEYFRLVRRSKQFLRVMKTHQIVRPAVHHQDWRPDAWESCARVVFDRADPAHWQPRKQFGADVRDARERALQHDRADGFAQGQFAHHTATQRFAERNNMPGIEALLLQPGVGGLRIAISSFFTGPASTLTVAAIVEDKNTRASFEQRRAQAQPVADVPAIAMANQEGQVSAR